MTQAGDGEFAADVRVRFGLREEVRIVKHIVGYGRL